MYACSLVAGHAAGMASPHMGSYLDGAEVADELMHQCRRVQQLPAHLASEKDWVLVRSDAVTFIDNARQAQGACNT